MPVSVATTRDPFRGSPRPPALRTPQARVLSALSPPRPDRPPRLWPALTRALLAAAAGYTPVSGTVTRALNGIRSGSTSGDEHPGLLALGYVVAEEVDVDGASEVNYRATPAGVAALRAWLDARGSIPPVRDAVACTNDRYLAPREDDP